jgi:hypothetical protein
MSLEPFQSNAAADRRAAAGRDIGIGILLLVIGIAVTAGTYGAASSSPSGGHYVLAYGPIAVGVVRLFRGLFRLGGS